MTTAEDTSEGFDTHRDALEGELGIDVMVITRDELTRLLMRHLADEPEAAAEC